MNKKITLLISILLCNFSLIAADYEQIIAGSKDLKDCKWLVLQEHKARVDDCLQNLNEAEIRIIGANHFAKHGHCVDKEIKKGELIRALKKCRNKFPT